MNNSLRNNEINLLIRPIGACNMNCSYCFDKEGHNDYTIMSEQIITDLITKACQDYDNINGTGHGGEFTLVGKKWLEHMDWLIQKIAHQYGVNLDITGQTNGTLLDDEGLNVLSKGPVKIGISYDGKDAQVLNRGYKIPEFTLNYANSTISVITKNNIDHLIDMYEEAKERHITGLSYNFVFDTNKDKGMLGNLNYVLQKYKEFIKYYIFDKNEENIYERTTIQGILASLGKHCSVCNMIDCINHENFLVITHDGHLYKCDTTYIKEFDLGYLFEYEHLSDVFTSERYKNIRELKKCQRTEQCSSCVNKDFCYQGCLGNSLCYDNKNLQPNTIHCLFMRELTPYIYDLIGNLSVDEFMEINKAVRRELIANVYIPSDIQEAALKEAIENV